MTETDIHQLLVQLKRLLERSKSDHTDSQDENMLNRITEYLYAHFVPDFFHEASKRGLNHQDFEVVYQDTFLRIVAHIDTYQEEPGPGRTGSGWIATIFRNCCNDFLRQQQKQRSREQGIDSIVEPTSDTTNPAIVAEENERRDALNRAWAEMTETDRKELRNRGRGSGRNKWHEALGRLRKLFWEYYSHRPVTE